jgi:hypothetical protein
MRKVYAPPQKTSHANNTSHVSFVAGPQSSSLNKSPLLDGCTPPAHRERLLRCCVTCACPRRLERFALGIDCHIRSRGGSSSSCFGASGSRGS